MLKYVKLFEKAANKTKTSRKNILEKMKKIGEKTKGETMNWKSGCQKVLIILCIIIFSLPNCKKKNLKAGYETCKLTGAVSEKSDIILFGDLHSHSINSLDAFLMNFPLTEKPNSERGPMESCYFARYCAGLDFWALTDHAEEMPLTLWKENIEAIRKCNDIFGGYTYTPEMVSFLGWEWTHNSTNPAEDWGHKNIVLKDTCEGSIPFQPIAAPGGFVNVTKEQIELIAELIMSADPENRNFYEKAKARVLSFFKEPLCPPDVEPPKIPPDCHLIAKDPADLYKKLSMWNFDVIVIPHGLSWGPYHPEPATWENQFNNENYYDPRFSPLIEIFSGHGNMEEFREYKNVNVNPDGTLSCPDRMNNFIPCCYMAGELKKKTSANCQNDPSSPSCQTDVEKAKQDFINMGLDAFKLLRSAPDEWLDCGECRNCFLPPDVHQPFNSVQAILSMRNFRRTDERAFHLFGFVGSTDSHRGGPGAGYKELKWHTDIVEPSKQTFAPIVNNVGGLINRDFLRQKSYFYTGGLVAVHSKGRSRDDIWEALKNRRVYATSGERILLWFNLINSPSGEAQPMGSIVKFSSAPVFEVKAIGSPVQKPGCPPEVVKNAPEGVIEKLCRGECFYPTSDRHKITRIEVVKILPQVVEGENISTLIKDPYIIYECPKETTACTFIFEDPAFPAERRPAFYYVRAIQENSIQINANNLRCEYGSNSNGDCLKVNPCKTWEDPCTGEASERAWSSPIFVFPYQ